VKPLQLDLFGWQRRQLRRGVAAVPPPHVRAFRIEGALRRWPIDERAYVEAQHQLALQLGRV
jgi:hypothetical protein